MSPVFPARRAEEFDRLVESLSTGRADGARPDTRTADLLELVTALRSVEPAAPRPEFSASLRERLMDAADELLVPAPTDEVQRLTLPPRAKARDRRIAVLVGAAAMVGASTSLAVAAQSALPGELLYPLKRIIEDAGTGAQLSDDARGVSLLGNATDRLTEVTELLRTGDLREGPAVASTLVTFSDQSLEASDLILGDYEQTGDTASVEELRDFAASSLDTLAQLEALLPDEAKDELQYAAEVLTEIDAAAAQVCPACTGGITQIPSVLLSSAGQVSEPSLVETVPAPVVSSQKSGGAKNGGGTTSKGTQGKGGDGSTGTGGTVGTDPLPGGGADGDDSTGPIEEIADALTGGGNTSTGGGKDGKTGIDPLDDVLDDVEDGLDDTVDDLLP
ncbi:hypothetical protein GCM10009623_23740 [Nocardioides aestuarii]|uniref:DUF5667 domain-containing protein n=1 Tax=Nocardioides aestuarii TaxID=252231 RepID=A0ABW4TPF5_9ACTN